MTNDTRAAFEAYWRERQLRTHRYTDRPCPDDWGQAFKADAEAAWLASRRAALEEHREKLKMMVYGLDGVIIDTEQGGGFDAVCLRTVKRTQSQIAELARALADEGVKL